MPCIKTKILKIYTMSELMDDYVDFVSRNNRKPDERQRTDTIHIAFLARRKIEKEERVLMRNYPASVGGFNRPVEREITINIQQ